VTFAAPAQGACELGVFAQILHIPASAKAKRAENNVPALRASKNPTETYSSVLPSVLPMPLDE
jgi:hypothetical protein